ncbi:MAG: hypothetical protein Q7R65_02040 [bacterium]|nr:hypothetical protein [bacterium]
MKVKILKQNGYNFLWIGKYLWMWDVPIERREQKRIADQAFGDVLVAGYGLGLVQYYLTKNSKVRSITTVEKLPEIIKEVHRVYKKVYGEVVTGNFYHFKTSQRYDCVVGDIWEDIVEDSLRDYNKFVKKAGSFLKVGGRILAWGQGFFDYLNIVKNPKGVENKF